MVSLQSAARDEAFAPTNVESLKSGELRPKTESGKALMGGAETRRSIPMHARLYRLALVAGVVAVFLEGLGASFKWV
jgi:hypothetical protein